jgi:cyanate permease
MASGASRLGWPPLTAAVLWLPGAATPVVRPAYRRPPTIVAGTTSLGDHRVHGPPVSLSYAVLAWLPAMLQDRGLAPGASGTLLSVMVLVQPSGALLLPVLADRMVTQGGLAVAVVTLPSRGLPWCSSVRPPLPGRP